MFVRSELEACEVKDAQLLSDTCEQAWCSFTANNCRVLFGCLYRPPDCEEQENVSISKSIRVASSLVKRGIYSDLIVCGDFNYPRIQWDTNGIGSCVSEEGQDVLFTDTVGSCGLHQHVQEPTFLFDGKQTTLIDLILSSRQSLILSLETGPPLSSSLTRCHLSILFKLRADKPSHIQYSSSKYRYRSGDYERMNQSLINSDLSRRIDTSVSIENCYSEFLFVYNKHCSSFIPLSKLQTKKKPWVTKEIRQLARKKFRLFISIKIDNDPEKIEAYHRLNERIQ